MDDFATNHGQGAVPDEYRDDPELYYAIQASLQGNEQNEAGIQNTG